MKQSDFGKSIAPYLTGTIPASFFIPYAQLQDVPSFILSTGTIPATQVSGLSTVATTGTYADLLGKPTIPTNTNQLTQDLGITITGGTALNFYDATHTLQHFSGGSSTIAGATDFSTYFSGTASMVALTAPWSGISGVPAFITASGSAAYATTSGTAVYAAQSASSPNDYYDSKTAGMVSGTSDQSSVFQAALNATALTSHGKFLLRSGTYRFASTINIPAGVSIIADGPGSVGPYTPWIAIPFRTKLIYTGTGSALYSGSIGSTLFKGFELTASGTISNVGLDIYNAAGTNYPNVAGDALHVESVWIHNFNYDIFTNGVVGASYLYSIFSDARIAAFALGNDQIDVHLTECNVGCAGLSNAPNTGDAFLCGYDIHNGMTVGQSQGALIMDNGQITACQHVGTFAIPNVIFRGVEIQDIVQSPQITGTGIGGNIMIENCDVYMNTLTTAIPLKIYNGCSATILNYHIEGATQPVIAQAEDLTQLRIIQRGSAGSAQQAQLVSGTTVLSTVNAGISAEHITNGTLTIPQIIHQSPASTHSRMIINATTGGYGSQINCQNSGVSQWLVGYNGANFTMYDMVYGQTGFTLNPSSENATFYGNLTAPYFYGSGLGLTGTASSLTAGSALKGGVTGNALTVVYGGYVYSDSTGSPLSIAYADSAGAAVTSGSTTDSRLATAVQPNEVNRTVSATATAGESTVFTGTSGQTLTLPTSPTNGTMNRVSNYSTNSVTVSPGSATLNVFGTIGTEVQNPRESYIYVYNSGNTTWYAITTNDASILANRTFTNTYSGNQTVTGADRETDIFTAGNCTLPAASTVLQHHFTVKNSSSTTMTIILNGADTLEGSATSVPLPPGNSLTLTPNAATSPTGFIIE